MQSLVDREARPEQPKDATPVLDLGSFVNESHRDDTLEVGIPRPFVRQAGKATRDRTQGDPRAGFDIRSHHRSLGARRNREPTRLPLDAFRQALVQPIGSIAACDLAEDRMRVLMEENPTQGLGRMGGRRDMNTTIEEADGLEGKAMGVGAHISRSPVQNDTQGFERLDPDRLRDILARFPQEAQHLFRVVARDFPQPGIDLHAKMLATDLLESQRPGKRFGIGQLALVGDRGESNRRDPSPIFEFGSRNIEERPQMSFRALEATARSRQRGEMPMRLGVAGVES